MSSFFEDQSTIERVRMVESDLSTTNEFIRSVVGTSTAIRASGITLWLALIGFTFQQDLPVLAGLALVTTLGFWVIDGYHGWLYAEAQDHAQACELLLAHYYNAVSRAADDPDLVGELLASLRSHRYGLFRSFRSGFGVRQWWAARPRILYRSLYPGMVALAAVAFASVMILDLGGTASGADDRHDKDVILREGSSSTR